MKKKIYQIAYLEVIMKSSKIKKLLKIFSKKDKIKNDINITSTKYNPIHIKSVCSINENFQNDDSVKRFLFGKMALDVVKHIEFNITTNEITGKQEMTADLYVLDRQDKLYN